MIDFLMENNEDVYNIFINRNRDCAKLIQLPFDQVLKRKTVVRNVANNGASVRIYVKGAPEMVIPMCNSTLNENILSEPFGQEEQERTLRLVADEIAAAGHKPITYAFKEIEKDKLTEIMQAYSNREEEDEYRHEFEAGLFYLGTFGLADPVRSDIDKPVSLIKYGHTDAGLDSAPQVNVRMITGDHLETAKAVAVRAGIVSLNELKTASDMCAMTGEEFRAAIGPYQRYWDDDTQQEKIAFENLEQFKTIKKRVKIIARATPEDKFILIRGIQQQGGLIGMAGDSIADSEALKQADVGLCMGSGCDVAKDNSDLIIMDNNFASIQASIRWGRAMFANVGKFLQFQMTINIAVVSLTLISGMTLGSVPLNVIQLLWMNLIMDILAAISLGTEPVVKKARVPFAERETRISRASRIFTAAMWRHIVVQSAYQLTVLLALLYFGTFMFFKEPYNLVTTPSRINNAPTSKMTVDTIIFNTFFMMNMFNQITCRTMDDEINIFKGIISNFNWIFWAVFAVEMFV